MYALKFTQIHVDIVLQIFSTFLTKCTLLKFSFQNINIHNSRSMRHMFIYFSYFLPIQRFFLLSLTIILKKTTNIQEQICYFLIVRYYTVIDLVVIFLCTLDAGSYDGSASRHECSPLCIFSVTEQRLNVEVFPNLPFERRLLKREAIVFKILFYFGI